MRVRVFPEPAGAITRAGPARWPTAAELVGSQVAHHRRLAGAPSSDLPTRPSPGESPGGRCRGAADGGRRRSRQPCCRGERRRPGHRGVATAAAAAALRACHHTGSPVRQSYVLAQTRKWSRSLARSNRPPRSNGGRRSTIGSASALWSTASSISTGCLLTQSRWSDSTTAAGSASTASSTTTRVAPSNPGGIGAPGRTTAPRPSAAGPGKGELSVTGERGYRRGATGSGGQPERELDETIERTVSGRSG